MIKIKNRISSGFPSSMMAAFFGAFLLTLAFFVYSQDKKKYIAF
mgnify:CR=1 FL=1